MGVLGDFAQLQPGSPEVPRMIGDGCRVVFILMQMPKSKPRSIARPPSRVSRVLARSTPVAAASSPADTGPSAAMIATTTMPIKVVAARAPEAVAAVVASAEPLPNGVVEAAAAAAIARLQAQARADVDLVKASVRVIDKAFYDAGQALVRLKRPHAYAALGYACFEKLCGKELGLAIDEADELVRIATFLERDEALDLTREKALAVVRLCRMEPENELPTVQSAATSPAKSAGAPAPDADPAAWLEQLLRDAGLEGVRVKLKRPKKSEAILGKVLGKASLGKTVLGRTTLGRSMLGKVSLGKVSLGKAVLGIDGIAVDELEAFCAAIAGRRA